MIEAEDVLRDCGGSDAGEMGTLAPLDVNEGFCFLVWPRLRDLGALEDFFEVSPVQTFVADDLELDSF